MLDFSSRGVNILEKSFGEESLAHSFSCSFVAFCVVILSSLSRFLLNGGKEKKVFNQNLLLFDRRLFSVPCLLLSDGLVSFAVRPFS